MRKILISVGLLVLATTSTLEAQTREGFWIGFGFGAGSLGIEGGGDRETAVVGFLKLGGSINDRFLIGGESNVWVKEEGGVTLTHGYFGPVAYFYPSATGSFFVKGGVGGALLSVEAGGSTTTENGFGYVLGVGYDILVGGNWSISPVANFNGGSIEGSDTGVFEVAVGITWH